MSAWTGHLMTAPEDGSLPCAPPTSPSSMGSQQPRRVLRVHWVFQLIPFLPGGHVLIPHGDVAPEPDRDPTPTNQASENLLLYSVWSGFATDHSGIIPGSGCWHSLRYCAGDAEPATAPCITHMLTS